MSHRILFINNTQGNFHAKNVVGSGIGARNRAAYRSLQRRAFKRPTNPPNVDPPTVDPPTVYDIMIESGDYSLAVKSNGTLFAWGKNGYGQLGNRSFTNTNSPVQSKLNDSDTFITNVKSISAGVFHSLALDNDGRVWSCGRNNQGQLGHNNITTKNGYQQSKINNSDTFITDVKAISAGVFHSLALDNDGRVWSTGYNADGQLGHKDFTTKYGYQQAKLNDSDTFITNVKAISAGDSHSLALDNDGRVWSCGRNAEGQLGHNDFTTKYGYQQAILYDNKYTFITDVKAISAGSEHSLALKNDGTVWTWGRNQYLQLGIRNINTSIKISYGLQSKLNNSDTFITNVIAISAGNYHSLALKNDGTVWSCGRNNVGQLGHDDLINKYGYQQVSGLNNNIIAISAGLEYSLALDNNGKVWGCGRNAEGQFGNGTNTNSSVFIDTGITLNI